MKDYPNKMIKDEYTTVCPCGYRGPHSHPKISTKQGRKKIKKGIK